MQIESFVDHEDGGLKCPNCESKDISAPDLLDALLSFSEDEYRCRKCNTTAYSSVLDDEHLEGSGCFVATVVYGDRYAPEVQALRTFRDQVLAKHFLGRAFIRSYYSGIGKRVAETIQQRAPSAIPVIKQGLDVVVRSLLNN